MHPVGPARSDLPSHIHAVAVIPARYRSTRFPGKVLADLAGKPLIEHVYRRASACPALSDVIVATDDDRVAQAVNRFGGQVRMTSAAHPSGTDRVAEIARSLVCDVVVGVQGDEPLVEPAMIDEAIRPFATDSSLLMSTLRRRFDDPSEADDPHVVKVVVDRQGFALYFSRAAIPYVRDPGSGIRDSGSQRLTKSNEYQNAESRLPNPESRVDLYKHIGLYAYRRDFLLRLATLEPTPLERAEALEQLRVLEHGYRILAVETAHDSIGVDTPEDLERVRRLMTADARV